MGRYSNCTYFQKLYDAVADCFPAVQDNDARAILRETILAPEDYEVEFNNEIYKQNQIYSLLAQQLTKNCINDTPEQTFATLLDNTANILKHMNDGFVTHEDYVERSNFLDQLSGMEFSMFAALAFLKTAHSQEDRCQKLILNIIRLREINELIQTYTRDEENIEIGVEEFERAKSIYRLVKSLQSLGDDYYFSTKERSSMGINHQNDEDLTDKFNYHHWLKRLMLLQLRKEINQSPSFVPNVPQNEADSTEVVDRISQLRGTINKRRFDKNRFIMLEKNNNVVHNNETTEN